MPRFDPNLPQLLAIARALGGLREQIVFVGGSAAGLLLTDPLAEGVRPTMDVDAIVQADSLMHFYRIETALADRGFVRDADSGVICRWKHLPSSGIFDLMPVDATVLGFSNRWYEEAVRSAHAMRIADDIEIRVAAAPAFVATKLEAFIDRGKGDFLASHDLEDVLTVIDGRIELVDELRDAPAELRSAVAEVLARLLEHPDFVNCLPGLIADADRAGVVLRRIRQLAHLA
ncbi:hypothetical protein [Pseudoxanthomonas putridarboris]|uniref:Nucleotidyl transferase AbiEii toxin, Type IV TA system n=1 Tax=Pseudoxanthomonas putridarboris TaxID=752605 RepID=A0ABU9J1W0_9GAMM